MFFIGYYLNVALLREKKSLPKASAKQHGEGTKRRSHATTKSKKNRRVSKISPVHLGFNGTARNIN